MKLGDKVKELIESGVQPLVLQYEPVRFFSSAELVLRTFLVVNSLELGTLTMREYRFVARRTKQRDRLVERHLIKLCREIPAILAEGQKVTCFTVPVYARLLRDGVLAKMLLETLALFPAVSPSLLCLELSADILYEDMEEAAARIAELRAIGVKVAISEVGDEFCPLFRLGSVAFDYAFLDRYATDIFRATGQSADGSEPGSVRHRRSPCAGRIRAKRPSAACTRPFLHRFWYMESCILSLSQRKWGVSYEEGHSEEAS